jgi:CheY-like chemotaxis protein
MKRKVLFIDDEASLRRTMTLGLSQRGFEADPCENGVAALKRLETYIKNKINLDAVIVDFRLPDIDGIKLAKIIKFKMPGVPVILISGYADRFDPEEIRDLKISAFLEKPFTPDELTDQFVQVMEREGIEEKNDLDVEAFEDKSVSAYMLIKVEDDAAFFDIYNQMYYMENVLYCDATKGDYDIFILAQSETRKDLDEMKEKILTMTGIKSVDYLEVSRPLLEESTHAVIDAAESMLSDTTVKAREMGNRVCSYLLMDVEKEKMDDIYPTLRLDENVIYCDYTTGKSSLVLFVNGSHFTEIDQFVQEKLVNLHGVLKVKEYPVINLYEM